MNRLSVRLLLLLLMSLQGIMAMAATSAGSPEGQWRDADQLRREQQAALVIDGRNTYRLCGQRPARLLTATGGKPGKSPGRLFSSQSETFSSLRRCVMRVQPLPPGVPFVSVRCDVIALRHIIR